jgi:hypothetical protein
MPKQAEAYKKHMAPSIQCCMNTKKMSYIFEDLSSAAYNPQEELQA